MKNLLNLTDEELMQLSTTATIELIIASRDGKPIPEEDVKAINAEVKRRGYRVEITDNFIRRVLAGEFDNADGIEIGVTKKRKKKEK